MRKLKLQVQVSVDGFIAGPGGEMDWMIFEWDDALKNYVDGITRPVDCILLGRRLAEGFIPHWASEPEGEDPESIAKFNRTKKVVFTQTLEESAWPDTTLAKGDLSEEIAQLKRAPGGDLIAYGGGTFVSSLIRHGLVDEFHLFVNPVALGSGMPIFEDLDARQRLVLEEARAFACGIALLRYRRAA